MGNSIKAFEQVFLLMYSMPTIPLLREQSLNFPNLPTRFCLQFSLALLGQLVYQNYWSYAPFTLQVKPA